MKVKILLFLALIFSNILISCNEDEMFKGELYEKNVYALSFTDYVFPSIHSLNTEKSVGYVTAYIGGTELKHDPVNVEFILDNEAFDHFNEVNYDLETSKYAKILDPKFYRIPSLKTVIDRDQPYGLLPIEINPEGLSPDSIYLIPLKIKSTSKYGLNKEKLAVLYQVLLENDYASQSEGTVYFMKGKRQAPGSTIEISVASNKRVFPLSKNKIRTFVDTKVYREDVNHINAFSFIIQVNEDKTLTLQSYNSQFIEVEQLGDAKDNYYGPDVMNVNRFYMYYRYRTVTTDGEWSDWTTIRESLKRQE